ncbi:MAG TPA: hypothetical protein VFI39_03580 [Gemmatimonadales bacterium]|nr:hypothetical protein [Gemmatimonadales bacterium]
MALQNGRTARLAAALIVALGCAHTDPGAPNDPPATGAFDPAPPLRLTLNPGQDHWPVWAPDGRSIWYVYEDLDRADRDQCLGRLPAAGGTRIVSACQDTPPAATDSLDVALSPAVRGGRIAWVRVTSPIGAVLPDGGDVVVAPIGDPASATSVRHFPYVAPSGVFENFGVDLQWLDDSTLAYVAVQMGYNSISHDTTIAGQEVDLIHLAAAGPTVSVVGGTTGASSLGVGPAPGLLYFTREGDSRVFQLQLPDTTATVAYDFGGLGVAQDVRASGTRLLAVVGGTVYLVDTTVATAVTDSGSAWRHPTFRPDGRAFAGERYDTLTATSDIFVDSLP